MRKILFVFILFQGYLLSAQNLKSVSLNGSWTLYYGVQDKASPPTPDELKASLWPKIPAIVPGNVELDLLAAGVIRNPEIGNNISELRKYEAYQWWYYREFDSPRLKTGEQVDIVFDGLDCFGTIWINGQLVGETDNMLIQQRINVTKYLSPKEKNTIFVRINPAVKEGQKTIQGVTGTRMANHAEFTSVRKAPHMYGWDIMPRLISAGLWRDVYLDIQKPTRFEQVYWMTLSVDVPNKNANIILDYQFSTDYPTIDGLTLEVSLEREKQKVFNKSYNLHTHASRIKMQLQNIDFWWPRGYGNPALYDASLRILDEKGNILDEIKQRIGIRTAELIRTDITTAESPGEFVFKINGEKIFVRGTNWVPLDALHSRDKNHVKDAIGMINDLNCNMIRGWGGNVYEDKDFFDLCDENGIMVWQDFAMACTAYPQDNEFAEKIRKEALQVVLKLRQHPSLVLWSGDNEIDQSFEWTFKNIIDPGINVISREVLRRVTWEFDPIRPFLPSSPYHSEEYYSNGSDKNTRPEVHLWGPRGYYKDSFYTTSNAHFVSEIGYHGCPNRSSLEKMFEKEFVYPWTKDGKWNKQWETKAVGSQARNSLMVNQINALFGECPKDLDQFIFASQIVQAEAMKFFVELWRMEKFRKTGIIWWNLRDGWPVVSDAVVDYYNSKKRAYYYIRQVQHNACVMIGDPVDGNHSLIAVNDTKEKKSGTVTVRDADTDKVLFLAEFQIPVNGKALIGYLPEKQGQSMWLIEYTIGDEKYTNHYLAGKAPFKLEDYRRWDKKLNIKRD